MKRKSKLYCVPQGCSFSWLKELKINHCNFLPFKDSRFWLTHTGRTAIYNALHLLGIREGDQILVPAYNCGTEVDPMIYYGVEVVMYRVTRSAELDLFDIERRITKRTRAIYITHYFGYPHDLTIIKEICRKHRLWLIEDCALALFSQRYKIPLGSNGDVSIFSFVKTLPIPDGGALIINNPEIPDPPEMYPPEMRPVISELLSLTMFRLLSGLEGNIFMKQIVNLLARFRIAFSKRRPLSFNRFDLPSNEYYHNNMTNRCMSRISKRMMYSLDPIEIVERRRRNYELLLNQISGLNQLEPLFQTLPSGVCPLHFPVITEDRDWLRRKLLDFGIVTIRWWSKYHRNLPWNDYPDACYLKDHVLALPIHQGLDERHIELMAGALQISLAER
jgi:dTDP-4-amino-4,6-dideoxygalactose transaminase